MNLLYIKFFGTSLDEVDLYIPYILNRKLEYVKY